METYEREEMSEMLNRYIAVFNSFDKTLLVLSVASGSSFIASSTTGAGVPVGMLMCTS